MKDRELLELIDSHVSKLTEGQTIIKNKIDDLEDKISKVDMHVLRIEKVISKLKLCLNV